MRGLVTGKTLPAWAPVGGGGPGVCGFGGATAHVGGVGDLIDRIVDAEGVPAARTLDPFGLGTAEPRLVVAVLGLTFWAGDDQPDLLADTFNNNSEIVAKDVTVD